MQFLLTVSFWSLAGVYRKINTDLTQADVYIIYITFADAINTRAVQLYTNFQLYIIHTLLVNVLVTPNLSK
jgi:hypothetical protein